jgi:hypothetical protein
VLSLFWSAVAICAGIQSAIATTTSILTMLSLAKSRHRSSLAGIADLQHRSSRPTGNAQKIAPGSASAMIRLNGNDAAYAAIRNANNEGH